MMFFILFLSYLKYQFELSSEFLTESKTFIATVNCIILGIKWYFYCYAAILQNFNKNFNTSKLNKTQNFISYALFKSYKKLCTNFYIRNPAVTTKPRQANGVLHVHSVTAPLVAHCISVIHDVLLEGSVANYLMKLRTIPKAACRTAH